MGWTVPEYSRPMVDAAGRDLVNMWSRPLADPAEVDRFMEAWGILNNWRSAHSFPLNTFQTTLRTKARKVFPNVIVAQRIKRAVTIVHKLERLPRLSLSKLQDVGGCRAIVGSSSHVHKIRKAYLDSQLRHELKHEKDYIAEPKESGYRGIHLVYRYISDRSEDYNGLQIELQLRSRYQHAWATAVETAGTFLERSLKSSQGPADWLEFFRYVSSAFALAEGQPTVPGTPKGKGELKRWVAERAKALDVTRKLKAFGAAVQQLTGVEYGDAHYFLLELRPDKNTVAVTPFSAHQLKEANAAYTELEQRIASESIAGVQAVLVSVDKLESLRKAYPNYFLDTGVFLEYLKQVIG
jgi:hypothetical protein